MCLIGVRAGGDGERRSVGGGRERDDDVRPPRGLAVVVDREERDHDDREEGPGGRHEPSATGAAGAREAGMLGRIGEAARPRRAADAVDVRLGARVDPAQEADAGERGRVDARVERADHAADPHALDDDDVVDPLAPQEAAPAGRLLEEPVRAQDLGQHGVQHLRAQVRPHALDHADPARGRHERPERHPVGEDARVARDVRRHPVQDRERLDAVRAVARAVPGRRSRRPRRPEARRHSHDRRRRPRPQPRPATRPPARAPPAPG